MAISAKLTQERIMKTCLICDAPIEPFIDFGHMPIANGFLSAEEFDAEYFFNLRVGFCPECKMAQLTEHVDREKMFHDHYAFFSSTSRRQAEHFERVYESQKERLSSKTDPFVAEIGSNDGILLKHFAKAGIRHLGIEPSANVATVAREQGVQTINEFFDENLAKKIVAEHGQADLFFGANVMCHIPCLHSVAEGIRILLKPDGLLMFEDPYLGDIVEKISYDQIYDEHAFYFSVLSVQHLFGEHGLEVIDVQPQNVHGGSMRYIIGHKGEHSISEAVTAQLEKERTLGLDRSETFETFRKNVERSRDDLMEQLRALQADGKRVVGYAATSKSTTVTNYCGITPDLVEFISDTTPIKQGKFSPGAHIPVCAYEEFKSNYPYVALLFGWNHAEEIMANEQAFKDAGGKWLVYVPEVRIL
jgi:methylation protein EvaC